MNARQRSTRWVAAALAFALLPPHVRADDAADLAAATVKASKAYAEARYEEAAAEFEKALALTSKVFGSNHENTAVVLNNLANIYQDVGQYARAEPLHLRALAIKEAKLGKDHPSTATTIDNLANLHSDMGQYAEAEALYFRALAIREAKLGKDHPDTAATLNNLALVYKEMGRYAKAEPLYRRALAVLEAKLGKDHPRTASTIDNLASVYVGMGQYAEAEPLYVRALAIKEARLGVDHPSTADTLNNLADLYAHGRRYAQAERYHVRALAIREAKLGKDHPSTGQSLNNLALLYSITGRYAKAEPLYRRDLAIREAKFGKDHPNTASTLNNLAGVYFDTGQYAEAEPLYRRSLAIAATKLGRDHPDTARTFDNLANLYPRMAEWDRAALFRDHARRSIRAFVSDTLPMLSEKEQEQFLQLQDRTRFHSALSQGLLRREHSASSALSAGWLLNGKAVAGQSRAEAVLLARDNGDPQVGRPSRELLTVRRALASLTVRPARDGEGAQRTQRIVELSAREQELSRAVSRAAGRAVKSDWVELAEVRKAIPPSGVLIEIARFDYLNPTAKGGENPSLGERYAAWVIPPAGEVRVVDLGDAAAIDAAVAAARTELTRAAESVAARGEKEAENRLRPPLQALAKLVLHPLLPYIQNAETWAVSPDGNLWLVPWAALPLADGAYAIERHAVRFVVSGRDLVPDPYRKARPTTAPLVVADPDFDSVASPARPDDVGDGTRGVSTGLTLGRVKRLPGTAIEAEALLPHLAKFSDRKPRVITEADAVTAVVRGAKSPKVLVLSTHGFFLEDPKAGAKDKPTTRLGENPLLRCGLLFAGCNNAAQAKAGGDTGVLTGLEIVGTDLRGTELVVLSACETGLGDVKNGEGVAGLRQAFQLAGAESVVATLWQVPDRDSALLMASFFDKLAGKRPRDEALAEAQREMIGKRRARFGAAHPYFWAAYTLTGQVR